MSFELLTLDEAAILLRISRTTLDRILAKGWLEGAHITPRKRMIEVRELEAFVERRRRHEV